MLKSILLSQWNNMSISTVKEIEEAISEYKAAMLEAIELDNKSKDISIKMIKSHKRISLARDEIRALRYN